MFLCFCFGICSSHWLSSYNEENFVVFCGGNKGYDLHSSKMQKLETRKSPLHYYMDGSKINEATVRLMGGNQIVVMLCAIHDLVFRVEDTYVSWFCQ